MTSAGITAAPSSRSRNSGSLPASAIGSCIRFIQKMMAKVLTVAVRILVWIKVMEKAKAAHFYRAVGALGRLAVEIETAAAELPG